MRCFCKHSIFVLVILVFGLFIVGCTSTQIGQAGARPVPPRCIDTDSGRNYYELGTASGMLWDDTQLSNELDRCAIFDAQGQRNVDSCSGVNCRVIEWFCGRDIPEGVNQEDLERLHIDYNSRCPAGCAAGVCAQANLDHVGQPGYPCSNVYTNPGGYVNLPECSVGVCDSSGLCKSETESVCTDGIDQDLDGVIDCADNDCSVVPECAAGPGKIVYAVDKRPNPDDRKGGELYRVDITLENGRFTVGNEQYLTEENNDRFIRWPSPSPDNSKIVYQFGDGNAQDINVMGYDGENVRLVVDEPPEDRQPDVSPDGSRIVYGAYRNNDWDVFVVNEDGSGKEGRARRGGSRDELAVWSPDGGQIAFASDRHGNGHYDLYIMNADGRNVQRLTNGLHLYHGMDWSPDGRKIAFTAWERIESERSERILEMEIYVVDADGRNLRKLTNNEDIDDQEPSWSPDGQYIAFSSRRNNNWDIYIMDANGNIQNEGQPVISSRWIDQDPRWIGSPRWEVR